ncbi:MAG: aminodeoxychorismate/anthranilate synthase component II [Dethiobacter sp.]|jgi:anthranilate synthase/aminodeoxychorismate synthase-like glutamine amidotransferase|nr:aminodeoxychorismate/anthranilate synthase component II [Dethiobacter sp.]MBS3902526.1 aminodeoxychorismate/anthranilate synthase component II [Dethiobacter sp.]MBS3990006.1 aminodeoxychorismate/anthranilate synthase component II [Dethiobacter sp.]
MLLMVDNYDSFTYNLVQFLGELGADIRVFRNKSIAPDDVAGLNPAHIIISPGPCTPNEAGASMEIIGRCAGKIPILGICLGHQSLGQVFGGRVIRALRPVHGKNSLIYHNCSGVFAGLPVPFSATRYHSLVIERETLPDCLEITAETKEGEIMGLRHKHIPCLEGVQFHPEAILTEHGLSLLANFLRYKLSGQEESSCLD